jgi:hypothetical protein
MGSAKAESAPNNVKNPVKPYGKVILTLKNKLLPDEKLSPTPSQNDGLDIETETDLRIYGCELIQTAGILLKLPQVGPPFRSVAPKATVGPVFNICWPMFSGSDGYWTGPIATFLLFEEFSAPPGRSHGDGVRLFSF